MIYKLTLLRDLPEGEAGFNFFVKGGEASHDGDEWFNWMTREGIYSRMYTLFREGRTDWVSVEKSDLPDSSHNLQSAFPNHQLMSFKDALDEQGFIYDESAFGINNIRCCNEQLKMLGATKADCIYCSQCGKAVQDAVNFLVWGLQDVESPRPYLVEYYYDPFQKYIAGKIKDEYLAEQK